MEMEPEQIIYKSIRECQYDINQINLTKSEEFFQYRDLYRLHVRTIWPESNPPKAVVMFIHGYVSHINRPTHGYLAPLMKAKGFAYVGFDFPGHGYSDGERALLNSVEELVDTSFEALNVFYNESTSSDTHHINRPYPLDPNTPLIIIGHSMGGSTTLLLSQRLKQTKYNLLGLVLLCPAIKIPHLPPALRFLLDYVLAPLLSSTEIPHWMNKEFNPKNTWNDDDYIKYVEADHYPQNPDGLGWGGGVRFLSGSVLLELAETAEQILSQIVHPFLMFFDPDDKTVEFAGGEALMEQCKTPVGEKELVILEGGGHDILINRLGVIAHRTVDWIEKLLAMQKKEETPKQ